ncbi:MAG TPA: nucleotidyltransferase domain-containing protein [Candidatus Dormibacteraeota bacterium]|nr:nucleotidyltransferase domain-containing protein [Candidatus Dormibacteraeota bacterium]
MARAVASALFGSATFPRLLAHLCAAPDRGFTATELESIVGASHDSLYRALQRGVAAGLVSRERIGKQHVYQIESGSPIFGEMKTLLSKLFGPADALRRALADEGPPAVEAAFLFGSAARAQDNLSSDLDVFVIGEISRFALARELAEAERELDREVNAVAYPRRDVERRLAQGDGFLREVFSGPKLMLLGKDTDLPVASVVGD